MHPNDARDWNGVTTVVTPSWFSDYVLTVGAVDSTGSADGQAECGRAVGVDRRARYRRRRALTRDDSLVNAIDGPDNTLLVPAGTSFSTAIVSGVAALVRAKYPQLSAHQIINRLTRTARAPARGVDNQVGYGVVDPVAALTWDVPEGPVTAEIRLPLNIPPPPAPRTWRRCGSPPAGWRGALLIWPAGCSVRQRCADAKAAVEAEQQ